jgi:hypothetical protein
MSSSKHLILNGVAIGMASCQKGYLSGIFGGNVQDFPRDYDTAGGPAEQPLTVR